jgi:hypothetical protein
MTTSAVRKAASKGNYYTDVPASNVAISRFQSDMNFVAPYAAARLEVNKLSGLLDAWDMARINRDDMQDRGDNAPAKETQFVKTQSNFKIPTQSVAVKLNDLVQETSDVHVKPQQLVGRVLANKALIRLETILASLFVSTAWFRTVTGTGVDAPNYGTAAGTRKKWNDLSLDPLPGIAEEIEMQGKLTGQEPTGMIFGRQAWRALRYHTAIRAALTSGTTPVVRNKPASLQEMAQLLELEWCGVSKAIVNTAGENLPATNNYIIPADAALLYYRPSMGADDPGTYNNEKPAALARIVYPGGVGGESSGIRVRKLRDEFAGVGGSDHWEIDSLNTYQVLTKEMGTLLLTMV